MKSHITFPINQRGFTIVELLIVIVVIAILAAISIVAYTGIQNRAYDIAVQSDLKNMAAQLELYRQQSNNDAYPYGDTLLASPLMHLSATPSAYGGHLVSGGTNYNMLYCRVTTGGVLPTDFSLVATSKSGKTFYVHGLESVKELASGWVNNSSMQTCEAVGIPQTSGTDRDFLYMNTWRSYVKT